MAGQGEKLLFRIHSSIKAARFSNRRNMETRSTIAVSIVQRSRSQRLAPETLNSTECTVHHPHRFREIP
jgi:hypothetical protein